MTLYSLFVRTITIPSFPENRNLGTNFLTRIIPFFRNAKALGFKNQYMYPANREPKKAPARNIPAPSNTYTAFVDRLHSIIARWASILNVENNLEVDTDESTDMAIEDNDGDGENDICLLRGSLVAP